MIPEAIAHLKSVDPIMASVIERIGPLDFEPSDSRSHFESVLRSITFQQLSGKAAATIYGRFRALFNGNAPTPAALVLLTDESLRAAGLSRGKTAYLKDLAAKCITGEVEIERLHELPDEEIIRELVHVKGIGVWTAHMFLMFRLARPDVLPDLDLGIRKAIQIEYTLPDLPPAATVQEIGARWRPYATTACLYLWRSLDAK